MTTPAIVSPRLSTIVNDIRTNGGATWHPFQDTPTDGYMVSVPGHEVVLGEWEFNEEILRGYEEDKLSAVYSLGNLFFGAWIDRDKVYLDLSIHVQDRHEAEIFGRLGGQLAIYEVATGQEIHL